MNIKQWLIKKLGGVLPSEIPSSDRSRLIDIRLIGAPSNKEEMDDMYYRAAQALGLRLYDKDCITWIVEENLTAKEISLHALVKVKVKE